MSQPIDLDRAFATLTGNGPFPWQKALFDDWFAQGRVPQTCSLPTGLGKTSVVAIWLIALAAGARLPRRLVYVVNRRTVVDQTTSEVQLYRDRLVAAGLDGALRDMCALPLPPDEPPLAISTLRGQFADNRQWSADPARPAVICGTVDMIGSRLLFSGYRTGFKSRPLHAGFLGQDVLLVHDEAHLEPAFQDLLLAIREEQRRSSEFGRFEVLELSATSRSGRADFELTEEERRGDVPEVARRLHAKKHLRLHELADEKGLADRLARLALDEHRNSGRAILIYVRKVVDAEKVGARLRKEKLPVEMLTGTVRGLERDALVERPVFQRFLPRAENGGGTVYLVCTSAGEVGVNISADHLVCDLTPLDSMAQRLGRVNRFGLGDASVDIVHPSTFQNERDDRYDHRRGLTLALLKRLNGDGSPAALERLPREERLAAFSPQPVIVPTSDILFDAWSLTTIHDRLPGRPPVADFLHGKPEDWQPPDAYVVWRAEVEWVDEEILATLDLSEILDDYPIKPHELLRDRYDRVFKHLEALAETHPTKPVWVVTDAGIDVTTLEALAEREKESVADAMVVLPPSVGGLTEAGTLGEAEGPVALDVADEWFADEARTVRRRLRVWADDEQLDTKTAGMRLVRTLRVRLPEGEEGDEEAVREWQFYVRPAAADDEGSKTALRPVRLADHNAAVRQAAERFGRALRLPDAIGQALGVAAGHHDDGKRRALWQRNIGNRGAEPLAKSGHRRPPEIVSSYRHEFGSLLDLLNCDEFQQLPAEARDLALHLVAAHHGRGRPHFPVPEVFDPEGQETQVVAVAREVPRRFARLQRMYGRWGLAFLESLLRAADWAASAQVDGSVRLHDRPAEDQP